MQVVIQGNVIGNKEFIDQLIEDIRGAVNDRDVIIDNRPPTKIAIDPWRDIGPRNL